MAVEKPVLIRINVVHLYGKPTILEGESKQKAESSPPLGNTGQRSQDSITPRSMPEAANPEQQNRQVPCENSRGRERASGSSTSSIHERPGNRKFVWIRLAYTSRAVTGVFLSSSRCVSSCALCYSGYWLYVSSQNLMVRGI